MKHLNSLLSGLSGLSTFVLVCAAGAQSAGSTLTVQQNTVSADYFYVSGQKFNKQIKADVVLAIEDISGGTGECSVMTNRSNTVVGVTIAADTVFLGTGSPYVGDTQRSVYQATVEGCLDPANRILKFNKKTIREQDDATYQEDVVLEFEADSMKVKSLKIQQSDIGTNRVFEQLKAILK